MPFRSMKMNRFICGFQRRVWCPKWTPASSRSFMVISATDNLLGSASAPPCPSRLPRLAGPRRVGGACEMGSKLPLAELEALARARLPVLLAFLHARIPRQEALAAEQGLQRFVLPHQRARHAEPDRAGLAGEPASRDAHVHVELVAQIRHLERLERVQHESFAAQETLV